MNYLTDSACRSIKYDDRATAISWNGQLLAAIRDFSARFDGMPPTALVRANRDISGRLARYIHRMDLEGTGVDKYGEILAEIEHADNPRQTIQTLQQIICAVCEDGPPREGILWASAYLAALADYRNPKQLEFLTDYSEVAEALAFTVAEVQQDLEANWALWRATIDQKHAKKEKEDD